MMTIRMRARPGVLVLMLMAGWAAEGRAQAGPEVGPEVKLETGATAQTVAAGAVETGAERDGSTGPDVATEAAPESPPEADAGEDAAEESPSTPQVQPAGRLVPQDKVTTCAAVIGGVARTLGYEADNDDIWSSKKERRTLEDGRCPAKVVIAELTPDLSAHEREVFCLQRDGASSFSGVGMGKRDAFGMCEGQGRACSFVKRTREDARDIAGIAAQQGLDTMRDSSGALVMSGSTGGIIGALSGIGSAAAGLAAAPLALAGAAASAVVVGGAVWVCGE